MIVGLPDRDIPRDTVVRAICPVVIEGKAHLAYRDRKLCGGNTVSTPRFTLMSGDFRKIYLAETHEGWVSGFHHVQDGTAFIWNDSKIGKLHSINHEHHLSSRGEIVLDVTRGERFHWLTDAPCTVPVNGVVHGVVEGPASSPVEIGVGFSAIELQ